MKFSVVIPTYKRPEDLNRAVVSVLNQSHLPAEILIIDDDEVSEKELLKFRKMSEEAGVLFCYYKKDHAKERQGLSESKNIALDKASFDIVFIDDDIVLHKDFLSSIQKAWIQNDDSCMIGVGGMISNNRRRSKLEMLFHRLFGLSSNVRWDVTGSGFQVWDESISDVYKGHYVHGGLCALKKDVASRFRFRTFDGGRTGLEDVDFALRAKNDGYFFILTPHAQAVHNHSPVSRDRVFVMGEKESRNRIDIFSNFGDGRKFAFAWSMTGWILRQFLSGQFLKGFGMIRGLL